MAHATEDETFWNRAARKYARDPIKDQVGYERTLARTRELIAGSESVLEVGCGTGTTALRLAPGVGRILATDVASEMIAIAREKAAGEGCRNAEFRVGTPEQVPPSAGPFDAVLAFNLLHLIVDRAAALDAIRRLLKPDGVLITKTACLSEMSPLIRLAVPAMRMIGRAPYVAFFTARELEAAIAAAGFSVVERTRHGTGRKDPRIFIVARLSDEPSTPNEPS
jgi:ubiquinone/menaquinone biosynthesis C-methylase UbiE